MQKKIRVGAVSYLNTKPLIFGLEHKSIKSEIDLIVDYPSKLANMLQKNELDIALLPIAAIPTIHEATVFSNYCIGSLNKVASVALFSHVPIEEVQEVLLDYQSRTSVALVSILLKNYWNIRPMLVEADKNYFSKIKDKTAGVIIGDRALENLHNFPFVYDLSEAWHNHTQLPFVFATWVSNKPLEENFIQQFNEANEFGLQNLETILTQNPYTAYNLKDYFTQNIVYHLNDEMKKGMTMFLKMIA